MDVNEPYWFTEQDASSTLASSTKEVYTATFLYKKDVVFCECSIKAIMPGFQPGDVSSILSIRSITVEPAISIGKQKQ